MDGVSLHARQARLVPAARTAQRRGNCLVQAGAVSALIGGVTIPSAAAASTAVAIAAPIRDVARKAQTGRAWRPP
jgi:hypothetical protein